MAERTHVGVDGSVFMRRYIDLAALYFVELDRDGIVRMANQRFCEVTGWTEDALVGKSWFETCVPETIREQVRALFSGVMDGTVDPAPLQRGVYPFLLRDGTEQNASWRGTLEKNDAGEILGVLIAGEDVSELHRVQRELEDMKFALDAAAIVAMTDAKGVITYVNDKFCEISKYSREELLGRTHQVINSGHHSKGFFRELWQTIESGQVWRGDIKNKAKDGSYYWVATTIVPFLGSDGKPYQYLAIRNEITARKQAEEALERAVRELAEMSERERQRAEALQDANRRIVEEQAKVVQAEKLSSIGLLAAGVAHEINNPLAGVMSCVRMLREETVPVERRAEYFEAVRDGLERIRQTVQGLLDFARPQAHSVEPVDLHDVVSGCLLLIAAQLRKKTVEADLRLREGASLVRGNRQQLMQAALNVLLNALHASPPGKRITIEARESGRFVDLTFRDEGAGIAKEHLAKVTEPFFTTKEQGEGTGLGLTVTSSIIQAHGGQLRVDSEVGRGTAVTFRLPVP